MDQIESIGSKYETMQELQGKSEKRSCPGTSCRFSVVRNLSPKVEGEDDDEIVMTVKFRKNALSNAQKAYVDFPFTEKRGESGPFKMEVTLDHLLNYYYQLKTDFDSSSSDSDDNVDKKDKDNESSSSDNEGSDPDGDGLGDSGVGKDTHLDEKKDKSSSPRKGSTDGSPKSADNDGDQGSSSVIDKLGEPGVIIDQYKHLFHVDQIVHYWDLAKRDHWVGVVRAVRIAHPAEGGDPAVRYWIEPEGETIYRLPCLLVHEKDIKALDLELWNRAKNSTKTPTCLPIHDSPLLPLNCVGIDTCSALSVSSERTDFPFLDESNEAKRSISLRGIGGEQSSVGGRGPMLISAHDNNNRLVYMVDPLGVFLPSSPDHSSVKLRILGQMRMKSFGFDLMQNLDGDGKDYLVYKSPRGGNDNISLIP
jgi:hypothetical protein